MSDSVSSTANFRGAMRHLAGGVSVITVGRGINITGMTVSSVSSLAVEPPTLIVSVNRNSSSWALLDRYGAFGINVLAAHQLGIAERFSGKGGVKGADRFAGAEWTSGGPAGVPLLVGALVAIECAVEDVIERHSHAIVIGRVLDLGVTEATGPLLYWHGEYLIAD
jgi:flavin reductase (DIM6/NTAB) family NADH-FMN oxidoreductase RutF